MSSTVCRSNAERLITLSTSAVAVCCCSDFASSSVRCLHLVEQPDILDRDHCLVGEGRDQLDLLVAEWSNFASSRTMTPIATLSRRSGTLSMVR